MITIETIRKRASKELSVGVLLVVTLSAGALLLSLGRTNESPTEAAATPEPVDTTQHAADTHANLSAARIATEAATLPVRSTPGADTTHKVEDTLIGTVGARRVATVSSLRTGVIEELLVSVGDEVTEGQVLARLDATVDEIQARKSRNQLASAQQQYDRAGIRADYSATELERLEELIANNLASESAIDSARLSSAIAQADLEKLRRDLAVYQNDIDYQEELVAQSTIRAPFSGRVTAQHAEVGEVLSVGTAGGEHVRTGIFTISDLTDLEIVADIDSSMLSDVSIGQSISGELIGEPGRRIDTEVVGLEGGIDGSGRQRFLLRLRVSEDASAVLPGAVVRLHLPQL